MTNRSHYIFLAINIPENPVGQIKNKRSFFFSVTEQAPPVTEAAIIEAKPVAVVRPANAAFSRSEAWVQSREPNTYIIQRPNITEPSTTLPPSSTTTSTTTPEALTNEKVAEDRVDESQDSPADDDKLRLRRAEDMLSGIVLPEGVKRRIQVSQQDVTAMLNDKASAERASKRLRELQKEFEARREQMSQAYSSVRKQNS